MGGNRRATASRPRAHHRQLLLSRTEVRKTSFLVKHASGYDTKTLRFYGGQDPRDLPAYTVPDVAKAAGIGADTLRRWLKPAAGFPALIRPADPDGNVLSYTNLVEAHVLAGIRKDDQVPMRNVRIALFTLKRMSHSEHPLAQESFETNGMDLLLDICGELVNLSQWGQGTMRDALTARLKRVRYARDGSSVYVFPTYKSESVDRPHLVRIDPLVSFGRATINGTGIPTWMIASLHKGGDSAESIALAYDRPQEEIEAALSYERVA